MANDFFRHIIEELDQAEERDLQLLGIVRCKNCLHRKTPDCPMCDFIEDRWNESYRIIDRSDDNGFCNKGVQKDG